MVPLHATATTPNLPLEIAFRPLFLHITALIPYYTPLIVVIDLDVEYEHLIGYFLGRIQALIESDGRLPGLVKQVEVVDGFHHVSFLIILMLLLSLLFSAFLSIFCVHRYRLIQFIYLLRSIG